MVRLSSFAVFFLLLVSARFAAAQCSCENGSVLCKCDLIEGSIESRCCGAGTICIAQECQPAPPYCLEDKDCGGDRTCTDGNRCTCATNADCGESGLVCGDDKVCFALCDAQHPCQVGYTCKDSRCTLAACEEDADCPLSRCVADEGHCAPYFVCATNFHCRNVDTEFGGAPRICGPEGRCIEPAPVSAAVACTCSLGGGAGEIFVPVGFCVAAAAIARLRAKTRRRSAARRSA